MGEVGGIGRTQVRTDENYDRRVVEQAMEHLFRSARCELGLARLRSLGVKDDRERAPSSAGTKVPLRKVSSSW